MKNIKIFIYTLIIIIIGASFYFFIFKNKTNEAPLIGQISEIDTMINNTDDLIKTNILKENKKEFEYSQPYVPTLKAIYLDINGNILKYIIEAGSDDSALQYNFYYDNNKILRFVLINGGAVNNSILAHKVYLNKQGEKISESHNVTEPGYTWPEIWPQDDLVFDPLKDFNISN